MSIAQDYSAITMMGQRPESHNWNTGKIYVERYGLSKPYFLLKQNDQTLGKLEWPRSKYGQYTATDGSITLDLAVGRMGFSIVAKDYLSRISKLQVKHLLHKNTAKMIIHLSNSDQFFVQQRLNKVNHCISLHITKKYYKSELFSIELITDLNRKQKRNYPSSLRRIAVIDIGSQMKWEATHFHQLIALLLGCIVFVGSHDQFRFSRRYNKHFTGQGIKTIRQGRSIERNPPRR